MSDTLTYADVMQRIGFTVIDNVRVVQYTCHIPVENPEGMRIGITKLDTELYKKNRDICRADYAKFEDDAYALQEEFIHKNTPPEKIKEGV